MSDRPGDDREVPRERALRAGATVAVREFREPAPDQSPLAIVPAGSALPEGPPVLAAVISVPVLRGVDREREPPLAELRPEPLPDRGPDNPLEMLKIAVAQPVLQREHRGSGRKLAALLVQTAEVALKEPVQVRQVLQRAS